MGDFISVQVKHILLFASTILVLAPECQAGTGGIFSSSTSPRRKIQTIQPIESPTSLPNKNVAKPATTIPPTPGTVFFDAKKSARPDGALNADTQMHELQQTLSGSSDPSVNSAAGSPVTTVPDSTAPSSSVPKTSIPGTTTGWTFSNDPQLRGLSGTASINANQGTGDVEAFFQINNTGKTPAAGYASHDQSTARLLSEFNSPEPKKSATGAPFRFLWHVMDNAGVPMFFGKNDDDLDPSLRQGYSSAVTIEAKQSGLIDPSTGATGNGAVNAPSKGPHKIPESELEGTDSWVKDNDPMP